MALHALAARGGDRGDGDARLGVLLGSATSQLAQSAGLTSIVLEATPNRRRPRNRRRPARKQRTGAVTERHLRPPKPRWRPSGRRTAAAPPKKKLRPRTPEEPELPPVKHVFLIVLGENGYEEAFGRARPLPTWRRPCRQKASC